MKHKLFCLSSLLSLLLALLTVQPVSAITGVWTPTGSMGTAREGHTATLLANGKVLVTGGLGDSFGYLASAELYDPATGDWTPTGSMETARDYHTATLLPNGKVLVTGGRAIGSSAGAELYDPATGLWTSVGSMSVERVGHTATLLANGKVLVSGGLGPNSSGVHSTLNTAELYDPATNNWAPTGSMNGARSRHAAVRLASGKVLVMGGLRTRTLVSAELYDPTTEQWAFTGAMNTDRFKQTATLLSSGRVLVAAGFSSSHGDFVSSAELYDPSSGTWTATGSLSMAREKHTATLLPGGTVLVAGGYQESPLGYLANSEVYNPGAGTWSATDSLITIRADYPAILLPNGKVLAVGGRNNDFILDSAELYTISTDLAAFKSGGAQDGSVRESSETSNQGGSTNTAAVTFSLGDNAGNRQYRSVLHFDTSSLPDNAVITKVLLKIKRESLTGTDPFTTHGEVAIDIRKGAFSSLGALQATDFEAPANKSAVGVFLNDQTAAGWYVTRVKLAAHPFVNRTGSTQLRLRFQLDDDNDALADIIKFHSGNSTAANRPVLVIEYYVP